ncbi:MAG: SpoVG family protein [Defluviitaleaceae bacterium]|nr:SpoVG family protein [Defluviitaleaceae bacterium]
MANLEQTAAKLDVRAFPIAEPKSNTVAFASVTINDMIAINGIRIVEGTKGLFAAMPQTKDAAGEYRDIAFPVTKDLRLQLNKAILDQYAVEKEKAPPEKASVKEQLKEGAKTAKETPAKEAPAAAVGKAAKKSGPEH